MKILPNLRALWAVYLRGLIILKIRFWKNLITFFLSPGLYALAFGWGIGRNLEVEGTAYLNFILPGLIALSGMNQSFGIASEINIARFLSHFFEEYLLSPANNSIIVLGNVFYGMTRGIASFCAVILIGMGFKVFPGGGLLILLPVLLNSFMFASLGVWIALTVKNHRDMSSFQTFVIVPMSFIAGTFFSLDSLPPIFTVFAQLIPLTHSSLLIRSIFLGKTAALYHYVVISLYAVFFFIMAVKKVRKAVT